MRIETYTLTQLIADEGKTLTNGKRYAKEVYLGDNDSVDNWQEVDESQAPQEEEEEGE